MQLNSLISELASRRLRIIKILSSIYLVTALSAFFLYLAVFINRGFSFKENDRYIFWFVVAFTAIALAFIRFRYIYRNVQVSFVLIMIAQVTTAFILMLYSGVGAVISTLLIVLTIITTSIMFDVKKTVYVFAGIVALILVVFYLHSSGLVQYQPELTSSDVGTTVVIISFGALIVSIAQTGYDQIEHSYQKAFNYAKELEDLNKDLDRIVKLRTQQLKRSLDRQADSVHSAAIMGSIVKPMLHDLATPISSLKGALTLIDYSKLDPESVEALSVIKGAENQITRIIETSRQLMKGQTEMSEFYPYELISGALFILKNEFLVNNIRVDLTVSPKVKIVGIASIFERIVVNVVLNAIEELRQSPKQRVISIKGHSDQTYFSLAIKDSGRGITRKMLDKIFEQSYSDKVEHLGFGLSFVKNMLEQQFGGNIKVDTKEGKYCQFTLSFKLNNHDSAEQSS